MFMPCGNRALPEGYMFFIDTQMRMSYMPIYLRGEHAVQRAP